jgi:hypothetical protein
VVRARHSMKSRPFSLINIQRTASTCPPQNLGYRYCREEPRRESRPRPRPRQAAFAPYPGVGRVVRAHPPGRHMYAGGKKRPTSKLDFRSGGAMSVINHEVTFLRIRRGGLYLYPCFAIAEGRWSWYCRVFSTTLGPYGLFQVPDSG